MLEKETYSFFSLLEVKNSLIFWDKSKLYYMYFVIFQTIAALCYFILTLMLDANFQVKKFWRISEFYISVESSLSVILDIKPH